jgi:hypothetical protein
MIQAISQQYKMNYSKMKEKNKIIKEYTDPDLLAIKRIDKCCSDILKELVSNCCSEKVWENTDICTKCGEHCEIIDISSF